MASSYTASDIEVLSGLDPVRRRPGMYTETTRPNHLAHEVIDNSVDEALAGHCKTDRRDSFKDGSCQVVDDGRGMPVDIHPKEKVSGVELILTRLHAGGKFNERPIKFSGGLHGVGVSVVNALETSRVLGAARWQGIQPQLRGRPAVLETRGRGRRRPVEDRHHRAVLARSEVLRHRQVFGADLKQVLRGQGGAVSQPARLLHQRDHRGAGRVVLHRRLHQYLVEELGKVEGLPPETVYGKRDIDGGTLEWALLGGGLRAAGDRELRQPDSDHGGRHACQWTARRHVGAVREFCEFRNLVPRGLKLTPEDVWDGANFVLSMKMREPQFAGQTKEKLSLARVGRIVQGVIKDAFALWLNQHPDQGEKIAMLAIANAQQRVRGRREWCASARSTGRRCPASSPIASTRIRRARNCSWSKAIPPAVPPSRRATASSRPSCRCAARS